VTKDIIQCRYVFKSNSFQLWTRVYMYGLQTTTERLKKKIVRRKGSQKVN